MVVFAIARGFARYTEQSCNHYIAFKLLALIRAKAFAALRRLCPAKLEGRDKGDLISVITSDIESFGSFLRTHDLADRDRYDLLGHTESFHRTYPLGLGTAGIGGICDRGRHRTGHCFQNEWQSGIGVPQSVR